MTSGPTDGQDAAGSGAGAPRDRRATSRAAIEIPAVLHVGTQELACSVRDLSIKGIALTLKESVAPGMVVRVVFRLPNSRQPVSVSGTLTRQSGSRSESSAPRLTRNSLSRAESSTSHSTLSIVDRLFQALLQRSLK